MNELQITNLQNDATLDSRQVAKMLNKKHSDLLRDVETYIKYFSENADLHSQDFFIESNYKVNGNNKSYKNYQITKKGCEFLAHKLTGQKGAIFTAKYIQAFDSMKQNFMLDTPNDNIIKMLIQTQNSMLTMIQALNTKIENIDKTNTLVTDTKKLQTKKKNTKKEHIEKLIKRQSLMPNLKILTLPKNIIDLVDILLAQEKINYSYIVKVLKDKGYKVHYKSIKNYHIAIKGDN